MISDKRANVPEVILVLGVIAIFALLIFSFLVLKEKTKSAFGSVAFVEKCFFDVEKFYFYQTLFGMTELDSANFIGVSISNDGNGDFLNFNLRDPNTDGGITQIKFYK